MRGIILLPLNFYGTLLSHPPKPCEAALCSKTAPPDPTKNFPQAHPPKTKRTKLSLCEGGCAWGKFSEEEGGLEGEGPVFQEGSLSLQSLSFPSKVFPSPPRSSSKKISKKGLTNGKKFDIIVRSTVKKSIFAGMAQLVEHVIGNDEVISSTLIASSRNRIAIAVRFLFFCFQTEERRGFEPWKRNHQKSTSTPER